jgi:acetyl/propionyl-CoA carboxylase alpha subunit
MTQGEPMTQGRAVIKRLLVANRGEIAVRIMATAAVMGIETVAVYPADDAACAHVRRADAAVELPGTGAAAYLDAEAMVAAGVAAGCDTLHPGYGFGSERPELATRCAEAGLRFVGPGPGPGSWASLSWPEPMATLLTTPRWSRHAPCCASTAR